MPIVSGALALFQGTIGPCDKVILPGGAEEGSAKKTFLTSVPAATALHKGSLMDKNDL